MPDTQTSVLNLTKPEIGGSDDTWGTKINSDLDTIDSLFQSGPALRVNKGGTGATTAANARTNLGLGDIATQAKSGVDITGGTIDGVTITGGGIANLDDPIAIGDGGTGATTAGTARAALGLGSAALQDANNVNITGGTISGLGSPLPIGSGGTGAATASTARQALGVAIGVDVQAYGADITAIEALTGNGYLKRNGNADWQLDPGTGGGGGGGEGTVTSVTGTGSVNGITLSGEVTSSGNLTLSGTLSGVSLSSQVSGVLPTANGGTGSGNLATARGNLDVSQAGCTEGRNPQTATNYNLALSDKGKIIAISNASANTVRVTPQANVDWPVGTTIRVMQTGTGKTQITAGSGVTIQAANGTYIAQRYGVITLERLAPDTWVAYGDTASS